jgi:hypothetical protein
MATLGARVVMFGGTNAASVQWFGDTWEWDGANWSENTQVPAPEARSSAAMAALGTQLVLFGGRTDTTHPLNDTWVYQ